MTIDFHKETIKILSPDYNKTLKTPETHGERKRREITRVP